MDTTNNQSITNSTHRDESIDLSSLLSDTTETKEETATEVVESNEKTEATSPLQQMLKDKENNKGVAITKKEFEDGLENPIKKSFAFNDERMESIDKTYDELNETMKKRTSVIVVKAPTTDIEYQEMMMEIDSVEYDDNGKPYMNYVTDEGAKLTPKFCRIRTEEDPKFSMEGDALLLKGINPEQIPTNEKGEVDLTKLDESKVESEEEEKSTEDQERDNIVKILIDKTGLGANINFSEDEKQKLTEAKEIQLTEVHFVDIESVKTKRSNKSFQETINEYQLSNSKTNICFPASGFRAQMKGLTYGEFGDIALSMDSITVDQYYKKLSIIYNKMTNISCGNFDSFEDFLKGFAYIDIPLATYGLYISTQPEIQQIQLSCGNKDCKQSFDWSFSTRGLLKLEDCDKKFLDKMKEIATAPASEYDNIRKNSAVLNSKMIKLPESGFVIEMGVASAYDFLYNLIPLMDEETYKTSFGEDLNGVYLSNIMLLTVVRSVNIPNADGTYTECTGYKEILDAIYNINPEEIKIITAIAGKLTEEYQPHFSFGDVICPNCKTKTPNMGIDIDNLVFQTYQLLTSTEINASNIQGL